MNDSDSDDYGGMSPVREDAGILNSGTVSSNQQNVTGDQNTLIQKFKQVTIYHLPRLGDLTGWWGYILALAIIFASTNFSSFSHLETKILGVTGVEHPRLEICFLAADLSPDLSADLPEATSGSWKLEVELARLDNVDLFSEERKEDTSPPTSCN